MTGGSIDPPDDVGAVAPPEVLAHARRVGPDVDPDSPDGTEGDAEHRIDREPESWELPPPPPPRPRLREQSVDAVFVRLRDLSLPQARAFLRAYRSIPRSELDLGGRAPVVNAPANGADDVPGIEDIVKGRAVLRQGAFREARANGVAVDAESLAERAREAVVDALSHASLRGGGLEEATEAAQVAAQDVTLALAVRPWISEWRFQELVEPWVQASAAAAEESHPFDILGAIALAFGVMALATFGLGRTSINSGDLIAVVFAVVAAITLLVRWRVRRQSVVA